MSFISGALDKSVFNKGSYAAAIGKTDDKGSFHNGYAVVKIQPSKSRMGQEKPYPAIIGVMDYSGEGLTFSIPSTWRDLGGFGDSVLPDGIKNLGGAFDTINDLAQIGGIASIGAAFASKLIYQQSGHLDITIPLMVVDWKGIGQPLMTTILLASYCLPRNIPGANVKDFLKATNDYVDEQLNTMKTSEAAATSFTGKVLGKTKEVVEGAVTTAANLTKKALDKIGEWDKTGTFKGVVQNYNEIKNDALKDACLRSSPTPVNVEIGQFFKKDDMVIKSLQYTFSKEMTKKGPLYVKFSLELSSRTIMVEPSDTGLFLNDYDESRYSEANLTGI